jgi:ATP-binding cassette subfamily B protein
VAKWLAILSAVLAGVIYLQLLVVLGLFTDLLIYRGQVPSYAELLPSEVDRFYREWGELPQPARQQALEALALDAKGSAALSADELGKLTPSEQERLWRVYVFQLLRERVDEAAAEAYRQSVSAADSVSPAEAAGHAPPSLGVLSLVVRTRSQFFNPALGAMARHNAWMWSGDPSWRNIRYLNGLLGIALVLALVRSGLMFLNNYSAAIAALEATIRMRRAIYHHTYELGTLAVRALGPSEAASVFTRHVEAVHDALQTWLTVVFREPVKFALLLAFALALNFWLALAFLVFAVLVWLIGGQVAVYVRSLGREATRRAAGHLALLQESLTMLRLVKCYLMELFNQSRVERQLAGYARAHRVRYLGEALFAPLLTFLGLLAAVVLLYVAGLTVLSGQQGVTGSIGMAVALVSLYWPAKSWLEHRRFLRRGRESAAVLFQFLDRPGEVAQVAGAEFLAPMSQRLEFDNVSLKEPGGSRILLRNVNLAIPAGQRVALVGPEDIQKYALVYLIPRFLDPTAGEIRVDGHNLRYVTLDSLRHQTAIVLMHNLVFNDTVANNIGCGDRSYPLPRIIEAAKIAHAHQFIQRLPRGYDTVIGELGHPLKIAEQFRIALARAVLRDPAIVIIEEPPAGLLDESAKDLLDDTFARFLPGRTAIFLPHRISTIRSCQQVFLLHDGRIEATGQHAEMLAHNDLYKHLHYLEFNIFAGRL